MAVDFCLERLHELLRTLAPEGRFGIAFSGGLDSRFLAHAAALQGLDPLLLHACGPHIAWAESDWAGQWAGRRGLRFAEISVDPLGQPGVQDNSRERCYACKRYLFGELLHVLNGVRPEPGEARGGVVSGLPLCDGSNLSDRLGYRPGMRAVRELGVRSPLAEAGFDKAGIYEAARRTGLDQPEQQARPCMLTRLAYGLKPTPDLLARLADAEAGIARTLLARRGAAGGGAVVDFRLRVPQAGRTLLHVTGEIDRATRLDLAAVVADGGLPLPDIEQIDTLSGYFDRLPR